MQVTTSWEEKGIGKGIEQVALNMLRKQMEIATIAEVTGLTIVQIQDLQAQVKQNLDDTAEPQIGRSSLADWIKGPEWKV